jgi:hypothetical protein
MILRLRCCQMICTGTGKSWGLQIRRKVWRDTVISIGSYKGGLGRLPWDLDYVTHRLVGNPAEIWGRWADEQ